MFCLTKVMLRRFSHCVFIHLNQLLAYHVWSHRVMMLVMMLPMQDKHKAGFWTRIMDDFAKGVACDSTFWLSMFTSRKWHERGEPREFRSFRIQTNKTFLKQKFNKFLCQKKNEIFVKEISLSMLFFLEQRTFHRDFCERLVERHGSCPTALGPTNPSLGTQKPQGRCFFWNIF